jgi:hypothetical protein
MIVAANQFVPGVRYGYHFVRIEFNLMALSIDKAMDKIHLLLGRQCPPQVQSVASNGNAFLCNLDATLNGPSRIAGIETMSGARPPSLCFVLPLQQ